MPTPIILDDNYSALGSIGKGAGAALSTWANAYAQRKLNDLAIEDQNKKQTQWFKQQDKDYQATHKLTRNVNGALAIEELKTEEVQPIMTKVNGVSYAVNPNTLEATQIKGLPQESVQTPEQKQQLEKDMYQFKKEVDAKFSSLLGGDTSGGKTTAEFDQTRQALSEKKGSLATYSETLDEINRTKKEESTLQGGNWKALTDDQKKYNIEMSLISGKEPALYYRDPTSKTDYLADKADYVEKLGLTAGDIASIQSSNKALTNELSQLQAQRGKVMSFAETAEKNIAIANTLAKKVDDTGSPIINKWLRSGKKSIAGNKDVAAFDGAIRTAINEYAKVVSSATGGGVTSDTARKEVEDILNRASTVEQVQYIIDQVLSPDLKNRKTSYDENIYRIQNSISNLIPDYVNSKNTVEQPKPTSSNTSKFKIISVK